MLKILILTLCFLVPLLCIKNHMEQFLSPRPSPAPIPPNRNRTSNNLTGILFLPNRDVRSGELNVVALPLPSDTAAFSPSNFTEPELPQPPENNITSNITIPRPEILRSDVLPMALFPENNLTASRPPPPGNNLTVPRPPLPITENNITSPRPPVENNITNSNITLPPSISISLRVTLPSNTTSNFTLPLPSNMTTNETRPITNNNLLESPRTNITSPRRPINYTDLNEFIEELRRSPPSRPRNESISNESMIPPMETNTTEETLPQTEEYNRTDSGSLNDFLRGMGLEVFPDRPSDREGRPHAPGEPTNNNNIEVNPSNAALPSEGLDTSLERTVSTTSNGSSGAATSDGLLRDNRETLLNRRTETLPENGSSQPTDTGTDSIASTLSN